LFGFFQILDIKDDMTESAIADFHRKPQLILHRRDCQDQ
jgi:hypothetical protein